MYDSCGTVPIISEPSRRILVVIGCQLVPGLSPISSACDFFLRFVIFGFLIFLYLVSLCFSAFRIPEFLATFMTTGLRNQTHVRAY